MAKADIDFEKELWDAANELRGAVSENNYKNYILPLVFLKHLSERYDMEYEKLETLVHDPQSEYYTTNKKEIKYILEDEDGTFNSTGQKRKTHVRLSDLRLSESLEAKLISQN